VLSNEPKMIVVHLPLAPQRGFKMQNGRFPRKIALRWRRSITKFLYVKTVSDKVVSIHWPKYPSKNNRWGISPSMQKFGGWWCADFRSIIPRSASAV